jgi:hypothetical protein
MGTYETIKTTKYIDGVLDSYLSWKDEGWRIAEQKAMKAEAMMHLTRSKDYQEWVRIAEAKLNKGDETRDKDGILYELADGGNLEDWWAEDDKMYEERTKAQGRKLEGASKAQRRAGHSIADRVARTRRTQDIALKMKPSRIQAEW